MPPERADGFLQGPGTGDARDAYPLRARLAMSCPCPDTGSLDRSSAPSSASAFAGGRPAASDEALAGDAAGGERAAFEELVRRHGGAVQRFAEARLGDHHVALDLTQEIWVRLFRALPRFDPSRSFRAWMFAIASNAVRDEGRRRERTRVVFLDDYRRASVEPAAAGGADDGDERAAIDAALARVPEPFRSALVLVDVEALTYEEAADSLGCAVGTAKSRVSRGRAFFRDEWQKLEGTHASAGRAGDET